MRGSVCVGGEAGKGLKHMTFNITITSVLQYKQFTNKLGRILCYGIVIISCLK